MVTCPEVVAEITNKRQLRRLVVLPYELIVKEAFPENVHIITEFAKKTGDYPSLSATDIKVMALTYQLEKEKVGTDHLRTEPIMRKPIVTTKKIQTNMNADVTGFYKPSKNRKIIDHQEETQTGTSKVGTSGNVARINNIQTQDQKSDPEGDFGIDQNYDQFDKSSNKFEERTSQCNGEDESNDDEEELDDFEEEELTEQLKNLEMESSESMDNAGDVDSLLVSLKEVENNCVEGNVIEEQAEDDDDSDWITPSNIQIAKKQFKSDLMESKKVSVSCMTTDFAMQNVLKQLNLNVSALDGRLIKQLRTFILRCYTCFKTTSIMTKKFCPKCGNNTLKKVAVSLDKNGKMKIHINSKHPLTARGKKYSLPKIKGGKHPNNPILVDDQPMPDNRPSRLARTKNNPLDDDYIAGKLFNREYSFEMFVLLFSWHYYCDRK